MYVYTYMYNTWIWWYDWNLQGNKNSFFCATLISGPLFLLRRKHGFIATKRGKSLVCGDQGTTAHAHMARRTLLDLEKYGILWNPKPFFFFGKIWHLEKYGIWKVCACENLFQMRALWINLQARWVWRPHCGCATARVLQSEISFGKEVKIGLTSFNMI